MSTPRQVLMRTTIKCKFNYTMKIILKMYFLINQNLLKASPLSRTPKQGFSVAAQRIILILNQIIAKNEQWEELQKEGLTACYKIEKIKRKILETNKNVEVFFPKELEIYTEKLFIIAKCLKSIVQYYVEAIKQLEVLKSFDKTEEQPVLRSWTIDDILAVIKNVSTNYSNELAKKMLVIGNYNKYKNCIFFIKKTHFYSILNKLTVRVYRYSIPLPCYIIRTSFSSL